MLELWTSFGFYLWAATTALVIIALAWLAWNTFTQSSSEGDSAVHERVEDVATRLGDLEEQFAVLNEAAPFMQATLGRALQYCGLAPHASEDPQSFSLAVANGRGEGFVISRAGGEVTAKPLADWESPQGLSSEEKAAVEKAHPRTIHKA
jgi:hypothetical protein